MGRQSGPKISLTAHVPTTAKAARRPWALEICMGSNSICSIAEALNRLRATHGWRSYTSLRITTMCMMEIFSCACNIRFPLPCSWETGATLFPTLCRGKTDCGRKLTRQFLRIKHPLSVLSSGMDWILMSGGSSSLTPFSAGIGLSKKPFHILRSDAHHPVPKKAANPDSCIWWRAPRVPTFVEVFGFFYARFDIVVTEENIKYREEILEYPQTESRLDRSS